MEVVWLSSLYPWWMNPIRTGQEVEWTQSQSGHCWESNHNHPAHSLVTVLIQLSKAPCNIWMVIKFANTSFLHWHFKLRNKIMLILHKSYPWWQHQMQITGDCPHIKLHTFPYIIYLWSLINNWKSSIFWTCQSCPHASLI